MQLGQKYAHGKHKMPNLLVKNEYTIDMQVEPDSFMEGKKRKKELTTLSLNVV